MADAESRQGFELFRQEVIVYEGYQEVLIYLFIYLLFRYYNRNGRKSRIVEQGSYEELISKNDLLQAMDNTGKNIRAEIVAGNIFPLKNLL
ncbi:hypothetical protein JCM30204_48830 [Dysgonomonas termitidis]